MSQWGANKLRPIVLNRYFLRFGRCVSAEPAADFAALLAFGLRSTFDAADAAFLLVTSLFEPLAMRNSPPSKFGFQR